MTSFDDLPVDVQILIYKSYFNQFVLPCIPTCTKYDYKLGSNDSDKLRHCDPSLHTALSDATMWVRGTMDVHQLLPRDRMAVYTALEIFGKPIMDVVHGRIHITIHGHIPNKPHKFADPDYNRNVKLYSTFDYQYPFIQHFVMQYEANGCGYTVPKQCKTQFYIINIKHKHFVGFKSYTHLDQLLQLS
jgi:hypothetical protein